MGGEGWGGIGQCNVVLMDYERGKWISCPTGALEQDTAELSGSAQK